jgi:hypothetical protein
MAYLSVTSRMLMSSGSWRREVPSVTVHYVTTLPPTSPILMSAIHSLDKSEVYKLSRSHHTYSKACREVNKPCSQSTATAASCCCFVMLHSPCFKPFDCSPRASAVPRAFFKVVWSTTLLLAMDVSTQLLIEESAIDLGSCLFLGKLVVPCLWPVTDVYHLKIRWAEGQTCFVCVR